MGEVAWLQNNGRFKTVDLVIQNQIEKWNEAALAKNRRSGSWKRFEQEKGRKEICAEHNISSQTISLWKRKYGEMDVNEARKLRALEDENSRMKQIIADQAMQIDILKEVNSKKWWVWLQKRRWFAHS